MESIGLTNLNSNQNAIIPIVNFGLQDQCVKIFSGLCTDQFTEISYNPISQEINIKFQQTSTLLVKSENTIVVNDSDRNSFCDLFNQFIERKRSEYSIGFIKQLVCTRNILERFMDNKRFSINDIDIQFFENFRAHYITVLGYSSNSFAGNVKRLKFFLQYALKCGWTTNDKFKQFKALEKYGKVDYLNWDELMSLFRMDFKKENLNRVRDCFVFQSLIGCRYYDFKNLTKANFRNGILSFTTQKTKTKIEIPLTGIANEIIDKYSTINSNALLPVMTIRSYNKYLKQIGKKAGLDRFVNMVDNKGINCSCSISQIMSSHMAHKNFIGNAVNKFNIRTEVIKSITGHSKNSNSFGRYYDIDIQTKKIAVEMMQC